MAAAPIKVAVIGATGRTGESIVNGLLASDIKYDVTAITRPSSLESKAVAALRERGVRIVAADVTSPHADLVRAFKGLDVLVSAIYFKVLDKQKDILGAVKEAGVGRFVPCFWGTPSPRGVQDMYDTKLDVLDAVQREYIPYTVIDVGWWTQQVIPKVPSGRVDHAYTSLEGTPLSSAFVDVLSTIPGDGNVPIAFTDLRDIGKHAARILADPRTLNHSVLAYTEVSTVNQAYDLMDELSGEKTPRKYKPEEELTTEPKDAQETLDNKASNEQAKDDPDVQKILKQYWLSWGVRGDCTPESAKYLGYLDFKELYPDVTGNTFRDIYTDVLAGKPSGFTPFAG